MKTIPFDIQYDIDNFDSYHDHEELFKIFWKCSIFNYWEPFDWNKAFENIEWPIRQKLIEHGLCDFEDFETYYDDVFCHSDNEYQPFTYSTDYIHIDIEDVKNAICKMHYEKSKDAFTGYFNDLEEIMKELENYPENLQDKITLFDKIIHATHVNGEIFGDIIGNIDDLRSLVDDEIKEAEKAEY